MKRLDFEQMTEDQAFCYQLLSDWLGGKHHVPPVRENGTGIKISVYSGMLSTFDFNKLTSLVFFCHDRCVRAEIISSGPQMVGIALWRRHKQDGSMSDPDYHPTIEQALLRHRHKCPLPACFPVDLEALHDPDFSDGLTSAEHLDVLRGGPDPRRAGRSPAPLPVAVSERLPDPRPESQGGDCNAEGMC